MALKRLTLDRFKGFGKKTTLELYGGIGALIGPNGCGKSNVVDAFLWVLGEQKVSALRGERMEDLIFKGSQTSGTEHFMEVEATFDNTQKIFELPHDEVSIKRRLYRSGEGEYFISGEACRLKDVQQLLFDTGLGRGGYSVIAQGGINRILLNGHQEKLRLIEEASGVTRAREKQREYARKRQRSEEDLTRIEAMLSDLRSRQTQLEKQTRASEEYFSLQKTIRTLELFQAEKKLSRLEAKHAGSQKSLQSLGEKIDAAIATIKEIEGRLRDEQKMRVTAEQAHTQKRLSLENDRRLLTEKAKYIRERLTEREGEVTLGERRLQESVRRLQLEEKSLRQQRESLEKAQQAAGKQALSIEKIERDQAENVATDKKILVAIEKTHKDVLASESRMSDIRGKLDAIPETLLRELETRMGASAGKQKPLAGEAASQAQTGEAKTNDEQENLASISELSLGKQAKRTLATWETYSKNFLLHLEQGRRLHPSGELHKWWGDVQQLAETQFPQMEQALAQWAAADAQAASVMDILAQTLTTKNDLTRALGREQSLQTKLAREKQEHETKRTRLRQKLETLREQLVRAREKLAADKQAAHTARVLSERMAEEVARAKTVVETAKKTLAAVKEALSESKSHEQEVTSAIRTLAKEEKSFVEKQERLRAAASRDEKRLAKLEMDLARAREKQETLRLDRERLGADEQIFSHERKTLLENTKQHLDEDILVYRKMNAKQQEPCRLDFFSSDEIMRLQEEWGEDAKSEEGMAILWKKTTPSIDLGNLAHRACDKWIRLLRQRMQGRGHVNPLAKQELALVREEVASLAHDRHDVRAALKNLNDLERRLTRETKIRFHRAFKEISKNFTLLIKELFAGGTGHIALRGHKDPDQRELDIFVQPQGKKLQSLDLFSGGEKSLIALSLMFAIFRIKPSPICILDEVDAALDDENVSRFIRLLQRFKEKTQVLVISHNRKTFNVFDYLYGISMREGISKVFSLKLPSALPPTASSLPELPEQVSASVK